MFFFFLILSCRILELCVFKYPPLFFIYKVYCQYTYCVDFCVDFLRLEYSFLHLYKKKICSVVNFEIFGLMGKVAFFNCPSYPVGSLYVCVLSL